MKQMKISVFYQHIEEAARQSGLPISDVLDRIKGFGISGVELDCHSLGDKNQLKSALDKAGLETSSIYCHFDFGHFYDREKAEDFVDTAVFFGAKKVLCIAGFIEKTDSRQECLDRMTENLNLLCELAEKKDIVVTMEDFDSETAPYATAEGLKYFCDRVPLLGITFDTGNFLYSGIDELSALDVLEDRVVHVHCKDRTFEVKAGEEPKAALDGRMMYSSPTGSGIIRIDEVVRRLVQRGYDNYLAIEHFGSQNQLDDMKKSAAWLRSLMFNLLY